MTIIKRSARCVAHKAVHARIIMIWNIPLHSFFTRLTMKP